MTEANKIGLITCLISDCGRAWTDEPRLYDEMIRHGNSDADHIVVDHPSEGGKLHGVVLLERDGQMQLAQRRFSLSGAIDKVAQIRSEFTQHPDAAYRKYSQQ